MKTINETYCAKNSFERKLRNTFIYVNVFTYNDIYKVVSMIYWVNKI